MSLILHNKKNVRMCSSVRSLNFNNKTTKINNKLLNFDYIDKKRKKKHT